MPVKIVYAPDASAGRVPNKSNSKKSLVDGKVISVKRSTPDDYKKSLAPTKSSKRMNTNPDVPKNLTPKGYTKMQLMLSIAQKKYDNIVRKMKGTGQLYEDPDFPASDASIGKIAGLPKVEWKRPKEINDRAEFIVGGYDGSDVMQGRLGDCWLLAVISSMADIKSLFCHICPPEQKIQSPDYVGLFKFRFWRFGQWVEVLIDDRIPVIAGTKKMLFMHSDESNEFWSALMEKAYAKLNGGYANLSGGTQTEAMEDMTGGLCESMDLTKISSDELFKDLLKYEKRCCLMGCSVTSKQIEAKLPNGLIAGHAYSVTGVDTIKSISPKGKTTKLVRVRNPWGNNAEWRGDWGDRSALWKEVDAEDKKRLDVNFGADGEFWMSVDDFKNNFTKLEVCHLGHESLEADMDVRGKKRLEETLFQGEWTKNVTAGGCANFKDTYWTNPQYRITLTDSDPTDDEDEATVAIGLMQAGVRAKRAGQFLTIGFCVYSIDPKSEGVFKRPFFAQSRPIAISDFTNSREVVARLKIKPGTYLIVPSTFKPNEEAKFILRIFTETVIKESECDDKNNFKGLSTEMIKAIKEEEGTKNEDDYVDRLFHDEEDEHSKSINAEQLREILNKSSMKHNCTDPTGFSLETARSMLASMDNNLTGKMEYDEFKKLWESMQCWAGIFNIRDKDHSKNLNVAELREALVSAGFHLSGMVFTVVVQRFVTQKACSVTFEDFMLCCVRLKNLFENFKAQFKTNDGHLMFTEDDFLRLTINQ